MLPCGVKRQTTRHLRQTATNLPANEDTSSFAFRVVGRTNFAVPRSPAATLIVIYDRGYFPCAPRIHLLFAYRSTALARLRTDRTIHLRRVRGFASLRSASPLSSFFSRSAATRIHITDTMIYRWFTITVKAVVTRNAFKTRRVFSRWSLFCQFLLSPYDRKQAAILCLSRSHRERNTSGGIILAL